MTELASSVPNRFPIFPLRGAMLLPGGNLPLNEDLVAGGSMAGLLGFQNDALQAARGADALLPVFILDPAQLQPGPLGSRGLGVHRARFLLESLAALDGALRQRGLDVGALRVKVHVDEPEPPRPAKQIALTPHARESLSRAAAQIGSPALRAAMERLARNEG